MWMPSVPSLTHQASSSQNPLLASEAQLQKQRGKRVCLCGTASRMDRWTDGQQEQVEEHGSADTRGWTSKCHSPPSRRTHAWCWKRCSSHPPTTGPCSAAVRGLGGTFHFPRGQLTHRLRACSTSFQALCLETKGKAILKPFKQAAIWQGPTKFGEMIPSLYPSPCISCPAWKEVCKTHPRAAERRTRALYLPDFPGDCHSTEDTWKVVKAQSCA